MSTRIEKRRITKKQKQALLYAAGKHDQVPTYSIAHRLEVRGFLVWRGPKCMGFVTWGDKFDATNRGWFLTTAGSELLKSIGE